jgi:hypothetical protein
MVTVTPEASEELKKALAEYDANILRIAFAGFG